MKNKLYTIEARGILMSPEDILALSIANGFSKRQDILYRPGCSYHKSTIGCYNELYEAEKVFLKHYMDSDTCWLPEDIIITHFQPERVGYGTGVLVTEFYLVDTINDKDLLKSDTVYAVHDKDGLVGSACDYKGALEIAGEMKRLTGKDYSIRFCGMPIVG